LFLVLVDRRGRQFKVESGGPNPKAKDNAEALSGAEIRGGSENIVQRRRDFTTEFTESAELSSLAIANAGRSLDFARDEIAKNANFKSKALRRVVLAGGRT
jgi:hypothetical protein